MPSAPNETGMSMSEPQISMPGMSASDPSLRSQPSLLVGLKRGISRHCPACGTGRLFSGYLAVLPTCPACGNDNEQYPSDDFAPYVTIFLVLHLIMPLFIWADHTWQMSVWFEAMLAMPFFIVITLAVLPFAKGGVIGFAWAYGVTRKVNQD
jgi:uncharacterized protein (DUF983 family)